MRRSIRATGLLVATAGLATYALGGVGHAAAPGSARATKADSAACRVNTKVDTAGGTSPTALCVPALGYDSTSVNLVWMKPARAADVVDYRVYRDGVPIGLASANATEHSPAKPYVDQFYADDPTGYHVKVQQHAFVATDLTPGTQYRFTVRAVRKNGSESAPSNVVVQTTAAAPKTVVDLTTVATPGDVSDPAVTAANTAAVQKAIEACAAASTSAYGCTAVVPAGKTLVTGALFLASNMTLEIAKGATLKGSPHSADYPISQGYQLYSYQTNVTDDRRPPSLLNLLSANHRNGTRAERQGYDDTRGAFNNVRVVGEGTLDCNGWKQNTELTDETGTVLPRYSGGASGPYAAGAGGTFAGFSTGILAKSQLDAALAEYSITAADEVARKRDITNLYANRRSSVATFRGVDNLFFGGLTILNPAYHGVMFLESRNIAFANTTSHTFDINNADGVEFGNTSNAIVVGNMFDTGDDVVNFAAGQGKDYEGADPSEQVWIFGNYMREGHGMVVLGSHTGAWIQDILAEDNVGLFTDSGLRLKSTPATGGGAQRVTFRDSAMRSIGTIGASVTAGGRTLTDDGGGSSSGNPFVLTLGYTLGSNVFTNAAAPAQFRSITINNVSVDNVDATKGGAGIQIDGYAGTDATLPYPETFARDIRFTGIRMKDVKPATISRLANSSFTNVTVTVGGAPAPATWWGFTDTNPNNKFVKVSPAPVVAPAPTPTPTVTPSAAG